MAPPGGRGCWSDCLLLLLPLLLMPGVALVSDVNVIGDSDIDESGEDESTFTLELL